MHLLKASSKPVAKNYKRKKHSALAFSQPASQDEREEVKEEPMEYEDVMDTILDNSQRVQPRRNRVRPANM